MRGPSGSRWPRLSFEQPDLALLGDLRHSVSGQGDEPRRPGEVIVGEQRLVDLFGLPPFEYVSVTRHRVEARFPRQTNTTRRILFIVRSPRGRRANHDEHCRQQAAMNHFFHTCVFRSLRRSNSNPWMRMPRIRSRRRRAGSAGAILARVFRSPIRPLMKPRLLGTTAAKALSKRDPVLRKLCRSFPDICHGPSLRSVHDAGAGHYGPADFGEGRRYRVGDGSSLQQTESRTRLGTAGILATRTAGVAELRTLDPKRPSTCSILPARFADGRIPAATLETRWTTRR